MIQEQLYGSSGLSNGEDKTENVWRSHSLKEGALKS